MSRVLNGERGDILPLLFCRRVVDAPPRERWTDVVLLFSGPHWSICRGPCPRPWRVYLYKGRCEGPALSSSDYANPRSGLAVSVTLMGLSGGLGASRKAPFPLPQDIRLDRGRGQRDVELRAGGSASQRSPVRLRLPRDDYPLTASRPACARTLFPFTGRGSRCGFEPDGSTLITPWQSWSFLQKKGRRNFSKMLTRR